jgi:murein DD-endopeptidase MepM/ murein hydrolase activator NlpD
MPPVALLAEFAVRHRRAIVGSAAALLAGVGALSFAVAPLAPDAADLPRTVVQEPVQPLDVATQLEALAAHDLLFSRSDITRTGETLETVLRRLDVRDVAAAAALRREPALRRQLEGRGGRIVQSRVDAQGRLVDLVVRYPAEAPELARTHFTRLSAEREGDRFKLRTETAALSRQMRLASGTIRSSLFASTDEARIPDAVATQMAEIFSVDIDFHRELRKGDTYSLVYEAVTADGEPVPWNQGAGRVLAAEFVNGGRTYQALWFEQGGKGAYFDPSGRSRKRTFLASPMEFSRVTSGFAMRMHPILQRMRAHRGVDYGAPTGTPVRVVGDGVVEFAGWQSGYGNVVIVRHPNNRTTLYAHLSRIDVRKGQRVEQGLRVGAVGATGWATGPHLHFEFRVAGVHQDPLKIARAAETVTLDAASRPQFAEVARTVRGKLDVAASVGGTPTFE